jgi:hypothetical protein
MRSYTTEIHRGGTESHGVRPDYVLCARPTENNNEALIHGRLCELMRKAFSINSFVNLCTSSVYLCGIALETGQIMRLFLYFSCYKQAKGTTNQKL